MKKKFILICCFLFINLQVSANNFDEIEIENQKCIENTFPYNYPNCAIQNEKNWDIEINNQLKKLQIFRNMAINSLRFINTYKDSACRQTLFLYKLCILLSIKENKVDIIERDVLLNDFSGGKNLKLLKELQNYYKKNKIKKITDGDISDLIIHLSL